MNRPKAVFETVHRPPSRTFDLGASGVLKVEYMLGWVNEAGYWMTYRRTDQKTAPAIRIASGWLFQPADEGNPAQSIYFDAEAIENLLTGLQSAIQDLPEIPDWHLEDAE